MPDRQISQLLLQVDANVAVAQRSLQDLARVVKQSTGDMNSSLATNDNQINRTLSNHHQLGLAFNNARIAQTELTAAVTRSIDAYGAGASPLRILSTEMGRLTEAASFLGGQSGALGKVAGFLGGPWGIAILIGVGVLAKLAGGHGDAKSAAEKHRDAEETLIAYLKGEDVANGALLDSLAQLNKERSKALDFTDEAIRREIALTNAVLDHARANKALLETQLGTAQTALDAAGREQERAAGGGKGAIEAASGAVSEAEGRVNSLKAAIADIDKILGVATATISTDLVTLARDLKTHAGEAKDAFDKQQQALEAKYRGTPSYNVDNQGRVITTLKGGLLNQPGLSQPARDALASQLTDAEHKLNIEREKGVAAAQALDDAEKGKTETEKQAIDNFKKSIFGAEGTGDNRLGSHASGFGQFMPATFAHYFAQAYPERAAGLSSTQMDLLRSNRTVADGVIEAATKDYAEILKKGGQQITEASLYAMHLLSAGDPHGTVALRLLRAPADEDMRAVLGKNYSTDVRGNPFLAGTAGSARAAIAKRIGDSSGAISSGAAAIDKALADAAQKQVDQLAKYAQESAQLDAETLAARKQLVGGYDTQADEQSAEIEAQRKAKQANIASQLAHNEINKELAAELSLQADDAAAAKQAVVARQKLAKGLEQAAKALDQQYGFQLDDLKSADALATTQGEHRKLQLEILDIQYQQKEADLEHLKATIEANKDFATSIDLQNQARQVQDQINRIPTDKAHDQARVDLGTMDPLQAWAHQVPKTAAEINVALQSIEVQGIDGLSSAIAGVITGTTSLKSAFKNLATSIIGDIVQMSVKMLIFRALSSVFGNGLGQSLFPVVNGVDPLAPLPARASGGPVTAGQAYVVGEHQPELFIPSTSGMILPSVPKIRIPSAATDRGDTIVVNQSFSNNFAGGAATQDDVNRMGLIARTSAIQAIREERRRAAR